MLRCTLLLPLLLHEEQTKDSFAPPCSDNYVSLLTYNHIPESLSYHPTAFYAGNNKEDTLTQSQMPKTANIAAFIKGQHAEIAGLQKFDAIKLNL